MRGWLGLPLLLALVTKTGADDWPQWRGPNRDGASAEEIAPWTTPPPLVWERKVSEAHSSPIVVSGRLYSMERTGESEAVFCLDAQTGSEQWRHAYPAPFQNRFGSGPRSTPTFANGRLVSLGATGVLVCLDPLTGKVHWSLDLLKQFGAENLFFGTSMSPLVVKGLVLVMVGAPGAGVVGFDVKTGEARWQSQDDRPSYASPIVWTSGSTPQAVFLTQRGLVALAPQSGLLLWRWPLVTFKDENSVTPLVAGELLIASSVSYGALALRVEGDRVRPAWQNQVFSSYFSSPVHFGEELYVVTGTPATLKCVNARTGEERWTHATVGLLYASLLRTADRLLVQTDTGLLLLVEPDRDAYRLLAKASVCGSGWIAPALSDGKLFVRDQQRIRCLDLRGQP